MQAGAQAGTLAGCRTPGRSGAAFHTRQHGGWHAKLHEDSNLKAAITAKNHRPARWRLRGGRSCCCSCAGTAGVSRVFAAAGWPCAGADAGAAAAATTTSYNSACSSTAAAAGCSCGAPTATRCGQSPVMTHVSLRAATATRIAAATASAQTHARPANIEESTGRSRCAKVGSGSCPPTNGRCGWVH
jgi:hypothetical protein